MTSRPTPAPDPNQPEIRTLSICRMDTRAAEGGGTKIEGRAVVYDEFTKLQDWWGETFFERISKDALKDTLGDGHDIFALRHHDWKLVIGRTGANLTLVNGAEGLDFDLIPNNSTAGRDMLEDVRSGLIRGCSIGFRIKEQEWEVREDVWFRTITKLELFEVTLTPIPAYTSTTAEVRSLSQSAAAKQRASVNPDLEERNAILAEANRVHTLLGGR